jgi:hypothetical protein
MVRPIPRVDPLKAGWEQQNKKRLLPFENSRLILTQ